MSLYNDMPFDDSFGDIGFVVEDVTRVIDEEVKAFHNLLNSVHGRIALYSTDNDASNVLQDDRDKENYSRSTVGTFRTVGHQDDKYQRLHRCREMISSRILVMVEQKSIERMKELRDILVTLLEKLERTNPQWIHPLHHSIDALDQSICLLTRNAKVTPYRSLQKINSVNYG